MASHYLNVHKARNDVLTPKTHELRNEMEKVLKKSLLMGMNKGFTRVA